MPVSRPPFGNKRFAALVDSVPTTSSTLCDADLLIARDGSIVNVEGWFHPDGLVVGEQLYQLDPLGSKELFGSTYRKSTLDPSGEPLDYPDRSYVGHELLDSNLGGSSFLRYKSIYSLGDFVGRFPTRRPILEFFNRLGEEASEAIEDYEDFCSVVGNQHIDRLNVGVTGSTALGNVSGYHDLDLVFSGDLEDLTKLAARMERLTSKEPQRRVFEGGKSWRIRFLNDANSLMCCFYSYSDATNSPLRDFRGEKELNASARFIGRVIDDTHNAYTPTVLKLELMGGDLAAVPSEAGGVIQAVIYHTASRGDFFNGDVVSLSGVLSEVETADNSFTAVTVTERDGAVHVRQPWPNFYFDPSNSIRGNSYGLEKHQDMSGLTIDH